MLRNTRRKSGRAEGSHLGPKASLHTKASSTQASSRELSKAGLHSGHRHHCTQATHRTALRSLLSCTEKNGFFALRAQEMVCSVLKEHLRPLLLTQSQPKNETSGF